MPKLRPLNRVMKDTASQKSYTELNLFLESIGYLMQGTVMTKQLQTFGYEGLTISQFVARLKESGTQVVVDVRANPLSRKPGFSKKSFEAHLATAGIGYIHAIRVGCPKAVRDRYKADGDWSTYTAGYLAFMKGRSADIAAIANIAQKSQVCLVCFEAKYAECHRSFVAAAVADLTGMLVEHITGSATTGSQVLVVA